MTLPQFDSQAEVTTKVQHTLVLRQPECRYGYYRVPVGTRVTVHLPLKPRGDSYFHFDWTLRPRVDLGPDAVLSMMCHTNRGCEQDLSFHVKKPGVHRLLFVENNWEGRSKGQNGVRDSFYLTLEAIEVPGVNERWWW